MTENSGHLWHGRFSSGPADELMAFTASLPFDKNLWHDDITGSKAHVNGLERAGLLDGSEAESVRRALDAVHVEFSSGAFDFVDSDEDIHTAIERRVTEIAGEAGASTASISAKVGVCSLRSPRSARIRARRSLAPPGGHDGQMRPPVANTAPGAFFGRDKRLVPWPFA